MSEQGYVVSRRDAVNENDDAGTEQAKCHPFQGVVTHEHIYTTKTVSKLWQSIRRVLFFRLTYMEAEVAWYKAELEKWQNALLQSKGLPSITPREPKPMVKPKSRYLPSQWRNKVETFQQRKPEEKPSGIQ